MAHAAAVLFDLDGVLVDSRDSIAYCWRLWAEAHDLDVTAVERAAHGRRGRDVIAELLPHADGLAEERRLTAFEVADVQRVRPIAGALELTRALKPERWAIVTSCPRELAAARVAAVGIEPPAVVVSADDVERGKPDPAGYLLAAQRLGIDPGRCLVVEDAPAGIAAGRAAGMTVAALPTTFDAAELLAAEVQCRDLNDVRRLLAPDIFLGADEHLLDEQRRYYSARAPEYDDWWLRRERYALDVEAEADWFADVAELEAELERFAPSGDVLELAAGTGNWTRRLVRYAGRVTAVDAVPEVLELSRAKLGSAVDYVVGDVFSWEPPRAFDVCFFGFWLSHVPSARFESFWRLVDRALKPGGRVFLVDNAHLGDPRHTVSASGEVVRRSLSDGREFEIVKRFWSPTELERQLATLGWQISAGATANGHFIFASGQRRFSNQ